MKQCHIEISKMILEMQAQLQAIANSYRFKKDFDWHPWLSALQSWIQGIKDYESQISERKDEYLEYFKPGNLLYESKPNNKLHESISNHMLSVINKEGRRRNTANVRLVNLLIMMYKEATGREPSCYQDGHSPSYQGEFYEFMKDMLPVLKKLGIIINKAKIESLGDYAKKIIPQRRKDRPCSYSMGQIDDSIFQK